MSSDVVFVTVTLSVRLAVVALSPLPRNKATSNKIKTAAPTTHTHGEVYQSLEVTDTDFVVVLEPEADSDPPLSWA